MADQPNANTANAESCDSRRDARSTKRPMQPPMTPMIDVTFQLLLFFLLTMTFRMAEGMIPGALPMKAGGGGPILIVEPIHVNVLPAGRDNTSVVYEIDGHDGRLTNGTELYTVLEHRSQLTGTESPIVITPSPDVEWGYVVEVFNQATRCEFQSVEFARSGMSTGG